MCLCFLAQFCCNLHTVCSVISECLSVVNDATAVLCRVESALQQNEIMDVFFDDWAGLTIDDGSFGSKADNHLKVCNDCLRIYPSV